jgi:hypothetical protein
VTARWRLAVLGIQFVLLGAATWIVEGVPYSAEMWFASGLLAVLITPLLQELHYARPYDVLANSLIGLVLVLLAPKSVARPGWVTLAVFLGAAAVLAGIALGFGAGRRSGRFVRVARAARLVSAVASARAIYSAVFWLALLESFRVSDGDFWILGIAWLLLATIGWINWQAVWTTVSDKAEPAAAEGVIGPSRVLVKAPALPMPGANVVVRGQGIDAVDGVVLKRIRRQSDVWGEILVRSRDQAEGLLRAGTIRIEAAPTAAAPDRVIGAVDVGSTDRELVFVATKPLEVGAAVAVEQGEEAPILYQLSSSEIRESRVKGGSELTTQATAVQIGMFDRASARLSLHRWTPEPGASVVIAPEISVADLAIPQDWLLLGHVLGSNVPVFLDLEAACSGHVAILGMTNMGKTSLAVRIARRLSQDRRVVILDQTGEYRSKRAIAQLPLDEAWNPGCYVHELPAEGIGPDFAYEFVRDVARQAAGEYVVGIPTPRSIMMDEAHHFIPEPAGLAFQSPGRDSAYSLGVLVMQLRKYGISMTLVSQRTAVVAKSALSQCETLIAFKSVDQTGLDYVEQIAGAGIRRILPSLRQGEALALGTAISAEGPVVVNVEEESTVEGASGPT